MRIDTALCRRTLVGLAACLLPALAGAVDMPPSPVRVATASEQQLAPVAWVPGMVISHNDARLGAEVAGRLLTVQEVGTAVAAGDAVAGIDDASYRLQLDEARALAGSERARLAFLHNEVERLRSLASRDAAAKNQLEQAEADRDVTAGQLQAAGARVQQAQDDLERCVIRAPFTGVVTERIARPGERVGAGDGVVRMVDPDAREVQVRIPVTSVAFVGEGSEVQIAVGAEVVSGRVSRLVPVGDDRSRLFELRIDAEGSTWPAGQAVRVAVPTAHPGRVIAVPRDALVIRRSGTVVYRVAEDGTAESVAVTIGVAKDDLIEVRGGIEHGDRVIVRGGERLQPGQKIVVQDQ